MYKREFSYKAFAIALLGLLFSILNIFGKIDAICPVDTCQIFDDFYIFGISLWFYSTFFFAVIMTLLAFKLFTLSYILVSLALFCDLLLLVYMMLIAPCFECLIVASILALLYKSLRKIEKIQLYPILFSLWLCFFIINIGAFIKSSVDPYAIYVNPDRAEDPLEASMRIYFSPSCTACNELVESLGSLENTQKGDIAWFAVAENHNDIAVIAQIEEIVKQGKTLKEALETAQKYPKKAEFFDTFTNALVQFKTLVNQSRLQAAKTSRIPFVEYTGIPSHLKAGNHSNTSTQENSGLEKLRSLSPDYQPSNENSFNNVLNLGVAGYCDENSSEPCD